MKILFNRIYKKIEKETLPKKLKENFRNVDEEKLKKFKRLLEEEFFKGWREKDKFSEKAFENDLKTQLYLRLFENRYHYIPWIDKTVKLKNSNILEIGCGTGSSTVALTEQGAFVTGIDIDESSLNIAKERMKIYRLEADFLSGNCLELFEKVKEKKFDAIIFYASLEHMLYEERIESIKKYFSILSDNSFLVIVETPNRFYGFGIDVGFIEEKKEPDTFIVRDDFPIEKIFKISSEWAVRDNFYKVQKARKILLEREKESVRYILDNKISTNNGLELEAINFFFKNCSDSLKNKIVQKLQKVEDKNTKKNIIYILSQMKYNPSYNVLKESFNYPDYKIKELVVYAIGELDTTVDLSFLLDNFDNGSYRLKVEIVEAMRKHKFDKVEYFVKKIDSERERVVRQAISNYLSEFSSTLRYIQNLGDLKNYEEYITIYKLISNEKYSYLIKMYKEYLKKISKIEKGDNTSIKGLKKRIAGLIEKNDN